MCATTSLTSRLTSGDIISGSTKGSFKGRNSLHLDVRTNRSSAAAGKPDEESDWQEQDPGSLLTEDGDSSGDEAAGSSEDSDEKTVSCWWDVWSVNGPIQDRSSTAEPM